MFKEKLKQIPFLYAINRHIKASVCKYNYASLQRFYTNAAHSKNIFYDETQVSSQIVDLLKKRNIDTSRLFKDKLCILWVGTSYDQDSAGIIQGLKKFGEVILFESQPGLYEQVRPTGYNYRKIRQENSQRLLLQVKESLEQGALHVVIGQMRAHAIEPRVLQIIREMGIIVVNISMDDRHAFQSQKIDGRWSGPKGLIGSIDLTCTAAEECCLWYLVDNCPVIYLPEASDPQLFKPLAGPKLYDVCFVGTNYGIRNEVVTVLQKAGVKVAAFGKGWPNRRISTAEIPELFARSRIILGVGTIGHCKDFYALKMRDFDGPMSGSLYITHHNPDLEELFVIGKEIETYRTAKECVEKVLYYLRNPEKAESIGSAGRIRAERDHTWEKRFDKVLRTIGVIN